MHPVGGGVELGLVRPDRRDDASTSIRDRIRAYADAHPDAPWITGGGWSMEALPRRHARTGGCSTQWCPDRPAYLVNRDHHGAWVNTRALELAGIDRGHPGPGRRTDRARRQRRTPIGTLQEGAMGLVARLVPAPTAAELLAALLRAQALLHSLGITAWQDAMRGPRTRSWPTSPAPT